MTAIRDAEAGHTAKSSNTDEFQYDAKRHQNNHRGMAIAGMARSYSARPFISFLSFVTLNEQAKTKLPVDLYGATNHLPRQAHQIPSFVSFVRFVVKSSNGCARANKLSISCVAR